MTRRDLLIKSVGIALLIASIGGGWWWLSIKNFSDSPVDLGHEAVVFSIGKGKGLINTANEMQSQGIISSAKMFRWMARFSGQSRQIQAGEYELTTGMTPNDMLAMFITGKVKQYSLTIVEGWNFRQMMNAINQHPKLKHTLDGLADKKVMAELGYEGEHPEGRFLPDTYHFPVNTSDVEFLKRAHDAMQEVLTAAWKSRKQGLPYKSAYEALTMASIVEKETAVASEREMIAGVFVSRLNKRMRLQTDPTVIYGMGDSYKGNITRKDLKRDTPYNTYRRKGLTPTPIAMPGKDAIYAAMNPAEGEYLYFVAKGDGTHHFSTTVKEHNRAVRKYQIRQRKRDYRTTPGNNS